MVFLVIGVTCTPITNPVPVIFLLKFILQDQVRVSNTIILQSEILGHFELIGEHICFLRNIGGVNNYNSVVATLQ